MDPDEASPLAVWELNHAEATKVLMDFAKTGDVNWAEVLSSQQAMLDDLLRTQDRLLSRSRVRRRQR